MGCETSKVTVQPNQHKSGIQKLDSCFRCLKLFNTNGNQVGGVWKLENSLI